MRDAGEMYDQKVSGTKSLQEYLFDYKTQSRRRDIERKPDYVLDSLKWLHAQAVPNVRLKSTHIQNDDRTNNDYVKPKIRHIITVITFSFSLVSWFLICGLIVLS
jgi:hypothetical protein